MKHLGLSFFAALLPLSAFAQLETGDYSVAIAGRVMVGLNFEVQGFPLANIPEPLHGVIQNAIPSEVRVESVSEERLVLIANGERVELPAQRFAPSGATGYVTTRNIPIQGADQLPCGITISQITTIVPQGNQFTGSMNYSLRRQRALDRPRVFRAGGPSVTCDQFLNDIGQVAREGVNGAIQNRYGAEIALMLSFMVESMIQPLVDANITSAEQINASLNTVQVDIPFRGTHL